MLSSILRPMVNTQIKLLAKSAATRSTLVNIIAKWLGFLGVQAKVTQLDTVGEKIQVSLTVSQPEASADEDWQSIVQNLKSSNSTIEELELKGSKIPTPQESKYQRVLAYAIQISNQDGSVDWEDVYPKLKLTAFFRLAQPQFSSFILASAFLNHQLLLTASRLS